MAGTGSNCTAEALRLTRWAAKEGADASLQVAPYYNKPTQRGFYEHFKAIASEVGIPHCVYNIPGRSAKNIEPETIAKLADIPNITMVKEATGSLDQCSQILNTTNLTVLSGDDSLTVPMMSIGAQGVISVAGNIVPGDLLAMVKAALDGDFVLAAKWHHKLFPLCRDMLSLATNPIPVKAAMMLLRRDTGELRLPMTALEPAELDVLRGTLERFGLMGH
jgi:4-hydroxy-tetrahydrodipicolinate synthase